MSQRPHIVILGGGFGGLNATKALRRSPVDVTLIDRRNFHLFQPLLYQVATGSLSPGEIAAPIRGVLSRQKNVKVLLGEAVDIDPDAKQLIMRDGAQIGYDMLIVATGSQSSYFGHQEWAAIAPPLKSIEDATAIRHKILVAFEEAERTADPAERQAWMTFVIVGAGATGIELAGALGEIAHETLASDFRSIRPADAHILVVDGTDRALANYPVDLSAKAQRQVEELGVTLRLGLMVDSVDAEGVTVKNKAGEHEHIRAKTVIWAAGVAVTDFARQLAKRTGADTDRAGHIKVNHYLQVPNFEDIYVVGDLAYYTDKAGKPLPGVAQVAMQGGTYAARRIRQQLRGGQVTKPFEYFNKGDLAVIGRAKAVANVFGIHLSGFPAWLVWLFIHLMYIVEFQSRIVVFIQWGFLYLTHSRGARLITGSVADDLMSHPHNGPGTSAKVNVS